MRFRMTQGWRAQYHFRFQDDAIEFRFAPAWKQVAHSERLIWTWAGSETYRLIIPAPTLDPVAYIDLGEERICTGRGAGHMHRPATGQQESRPLVRWEFEDGSVVVSEGGSLCCRRIPRTWSIRQLNGRRLAFWLVRRGGYEGVWREGPAECTLPIIAGMIVAEYYDPY
jgi:hypothetical protein